MFDQLSSLDTSRTTWRVKVRITRMWPSIAGSSKGSGSGSEGLKGYNLILLDDDNFHVHAFVYADQWKTIANKIVEGGLYVISNFFTKEAKGSLRPVSSQILINFSPSTTIERIDRDDFMIPMHKFEFVDLGDLFTVASALENVEFPEYSTDVIGALENFEDVSKISTKFGERDIAKFRLTDGPNSHMVTVWGPLAIATDARFREIKEKRIIAILTSTKLKTFRKSVQISTLPSSKIYLNLDNDDAVIAMRHRLDEQGYIDPEKLLSSPTQTVVDPIPTPSAVIEALTLKQLSEKTSTTFLQSYFLCKVKVKEVEETDNWWYFSCTSSKCNEEIIRVEGKIRCPRCTKNLPVAEKRYRIVLLAEDSTEAFNFVLLDRAARRLIGKTATKLIADHNQNVSTKAYPPKIKEIAGKDLTLKVQLNDDNILLHSKVFYAHDAYDVEHPNSSTSEAGTSSFTASGFGDNNVVDLVDGGSTPGSAISTSKKIKTEK